MPFAEVAVYARRPTQQTFTYAIPDDLPVRPGDGVFVPFGRRVLQGIVLALNDRTAIDAPRSIHGRIQDQPLLTLQHLRVATWIAEHYLAPIFSAVALFLPPGFERLPKRRLHAVPMPDAEALATLSRSQRRLLDAVSARSDGVSAHAAARAHGIDAAAVARTLVERGLLEERQAALPQPRSAVRTHSVLGLSQEREAVAAMLAAWPQSRRSRHADLLERLLEGPLAVADARRIGRASLDRWLGSSALMRLHAGALQLTAPVETVRAAIAALRRTAAERRRHTLLTALLDGPRGEAGLRRETGATHADLRALIERGLLTRHEERVPHDPLAARTVPRVEPPALAEDQQRAAHAINTALDGACAARAAGRPEGALFLLHGVTGSGKTEVYLAAVDHVRAQGGRAIVLVPEIALTPQTVDRFLARLPGRVAVLHSALAAAEAADQWQRIRDGEIDVVIGSRSALFAPQPDLALIVVDEEHEWTYKQTDPAPRYHVREVVERYCRETGAVAVFGSATPDLLTMQRARVGQYRLLALPQRVRRVRPEDYTSPLQAVPLPSVEIVDMREELHAGNRSIFSASLRSGVQEALDAGDQVMLFLNRRGASVLVCRACGDAHTCTRCSVPFTYHATDNRVRCHKCGREQAPPARCPTCGSNRLRPMGAGTQRLEIEVRKQFPQARPLRWDRDTTRGRHGHEEILDRFRRGEANVLVGTQMIAKGLDLPAVTLVGVVNADLSLRLPDFTGPERTFQLVTQVAGRAGRGPAGGRVIVQTYAPDHYAITAAAAHDYESFYEAEIAARAPFDYPPLGRLARLVFAAGAAERAEAMARRMAERLHEERDRRGLPGPEILGPTPAFIARRRGRHRWQITLRGADPLPLLRNIDLDRGWTVDVDPVSLL